MENLSYVVLAAKENGFKSKEMEDDSKTSFIRKIGKVYLRNEGKCILSILYYYRIL